MTGLTPCLRAAVKSCTAPASEPWSVRLTAGISSSAALETRSGIRHAPSRIEYSEWTCRWTKLASDMPGPRYRGRRTAPFRARLGNQLGAGIASRDRLVCSYQGNVASHGEGHIRGVVCAQTGCDRDAQHPRSEVAVRHELDRQIQEVLEQPGSGRVVDAREPGGRDECVQRLRHEDPRSRELVSAYDLLGLG